MGNMCEKAFLFAILGSLVSAVTIPGASSYNGLNLVPQMGWNTWNAFACDVSQDLILSTANSMVENGLRDLGYSYVVLDDCWSSGRNSSGYLVPDENKFPRGMKYISDQLHSMGLKFGMYSSAGTYTCARYPGSLGFETKDAEFFAENGVDYLKYDNCYNQGQSGTAKLSYDRYNVMSEALNATGRSIVYAMCSWGSDNPFDWAQTIANSGRMSGDIYDSFNRPDSRCSCTETPCQWPGFKCSVLNILNKMAPIVSRTQSGYFSDMDMLEIGNGGQSDPEYVTHFTFWALMSSPLLMGTDVRSISPSHYSILANPAVIAVNQDPSATAAVRIWRILCDDVDENGQCEQALWVRELDNGDVAVALLNAANSSSTLRATLEDIFLDDSTSGTTKPAPQLGETWDVYDLWANRMSYEEAAMVLNGTAPIIEAQSKTRFNATKTTYADGLESESPALFGSKVGTVQPHGTWSAEIARHSTGFWRFRMASKKRDEL